MPAFCGQIFLGFRRTIPKFCGISLTKVTGCLNQLSQSAQYRLEHGGEFEDNVSPIANHLNLSVAENIPL
jgi:hypothetical protein